MGASIDDGGLATAFGALKEVKQMRELSLCNTRITDASLVHLKASPWITQLDLGKTRITNAGLAHLQAITDLAILDLDATRVTDDGIAHLMKTKGLRAIGLDATLITGSGLKRLNSLPRLKRVSYRKHQLTEKQELELQKGFLGLRLFFVEQCGTRSFFRKTRRMP